MGICSSCIGRRRDRGVEENPETSRLLYDDPYRNAYGSMSQHPQHRTDPEAERQERERLEGICHGMSDNVIDTSTVRGGAESTQADVLERLDDPSKVTSTVRPRIEERDSSEANIKYKSVKKSPKRHASNPWRTNGGNSEAAKAVMG